jgi:uncharacterized protein YjiK
MLRKTMLLVFAFLLASCSIKEHSPTIRFPYKWLEGNIDQYNLVEPSGICFHPKNRTFFVVSDEGEVMEMNKDGTYLWSVKIPGDLEGITIDPQSGLLYIVVEGNDVILEFDSSKKEILRRFPVNRAFDGDPNYLQKQSQGFDNGIESIAFVPDASHPDGGTFYVGNQWDPARVMEIHIPLKTSQEGPQEARILRVLPLKIDDPSAMYYDHERGLLNIVSDADNILVEVTLEGEIVQEYAFLGDEQEGLAKDDESYLYIAQDSGGVVKIIDLR